MVAYRQVPKVAASSVMAPCLQQGAHGSAPRGQEAVDGGVAVRLRVARYAKPNGGSHVVGDGPSTEGKVPSI
eukprot:6682905-Alexandrium_andersonii.AAC.1